MIRNYKVFFLVTILAAQVYYAQIKTIAVLDLDAKGVTVVEASVLTDRLRSELVNIGTYVVVDRNNMEQILTEQGFQLSGCVSNECVVEVGMNLGVQYMLTGSIGKIGDGYTTQLQILDVETTEITKSAAYDYQGEIETLLKNGIQSALYRLLGIDEILEEISLLGTGIIDLTVHPSGAKLLIDGIEYSTEQIQHLEMLIGRHTVEVTKPNYYKYSKEIVIQENTTFPLSVNLVNGEKDLAQLKRNRRMLIFGVGSSFGATLLSAFSAQSTYKKYNDSYSVDDAPSYREKTKILDAITIGFSTVTLGTMVYTYLNKKKIGKLQRELGVEK